MVVLSIARHGGRSLKCLWINTDVFLSKDGETFKELKAADYIPVGATLNVDGIKCRIDAVGDSGRRKYNRFCVRCVHSCKQSFRADLIACPHFSRKASRCRQLGGEKACDCKPQSGEK